MLTRTHFLPGFVGLLLAMASLPAVAQTAPPATSGRTLATPPFGNVVDLNGVDDAVTSAGPAYTANDNFTLEAWVKPAVLPTASFETIITNGFDNGAVGNGVALGIGSGVGQNGGSKLVLQLCGVAFFNTNISLPTAGQWYHVAITRRAGTCFTYLDGVQAPNTFANTPVAIQTSGSTTSTLRVGAQQGFSFVNGQRFFHGQIDEARAWTVGRTQAEIQTAMGGEVNPNTAGLAAYWRFNRNGQGAGLTVANLASSGAALDGTTVGTASTPVFTGALVADLVITARSPTRNLRNAPAASSVGITFDQPISGAAASLAGVRVFSHRRGGRMSGTQGGAASASGNTITFNPTTDFRPGETVFVTTTTAATSTGGATLARGQVHQFTAATGGTGTGNFVAPAVNPEVSVGTGPRSVAVGDVDGDGDLDLLAANTDNSSGNTVSVRLNTGSGSFSGGSTVSVDAGPRYVALGDVDGDGDLDLLTANSFANTVSIRFNDGTGTFSGTQNIGTGTDTSPSGLAVGDVDGDGDLDLLTANTGTFNGTGATVSVRLNDGAGVFSGNQNVPVGVGPVQVAVGDVDGDGDLDFATANAGTGSNAVSVRLNDGAGTFNGTQEVNVNSFPRGVALGDIDADGDLDLVASSPGNSTVSVRVNDGAGAFSGSQAVSFGVRQPLEVVLGDVDADGDLDLLSVDINGAVGVRLNNAGLFSGTTEVVVGGFSFGLALGDVDGDGDLDLLTASAGGTVSVRLNVPGPTITGFTPTSGPPGQSVTITGTNLTGATAIRFNGTAATVFNVSSANTATATVPTGASSGTISVITAGGTATSTGTFSVCPAPPTLAGFTLLGIQNQKAIYISAGTATWTAAQAACVAVGGNLVTIPDAATNAFITAATGNALCWIGLTDAAVEGQYRWVSDNSLATFFNWCNNQPDNSTSFDASGEDFGTIGLSFCGFAGGWNDAENNHTFQAPQPRFLLELPVCAPPAPTITGFTPTSGPSGTSVSITGTNLTGITGVSFNGTAATVFSTGTGTTATATVPAGATSGTISVTTAGGTATSAGTFSVCPAPPTLAGFTLLGIQNQKAIYLSTATATWTAAQAACVAAGGNLVTIPDATTNAFITAATGNALCWTGLNDVAVEGQYRWVSDNSLATFFNWCNNQPDNATAFGATGEDFGTIGRNGCASGTWNDADNNHSFETPQPRFLLELPVCAPPATDITFFPTAGSPGSVVLVTKGSGADFTTATSARFNGAAATGTTFNTATQVTATVPSGATTGVLTTLTGATTLTGGTFTVTSGTSLPAPVLRNFSPVRAPVGTVLALFGANFNGVTAVRFGTTNAPGFVVQSANGILVPVPAGAQTGDRIYVLAQGGMAQSMRAFTLIPPPTLSATFPSFGTAQALVQLTGTNLTNATSVSFNGTDATAFTVNSATSITATIPVGATTGPITVTTVAGTATAPGSFTVNTTPAAPSISGFSPASGNVGTAVTVTGTSLTGATLVRFGALAGTGLTPLSATQVRASVPAGATTAPIWVLTPGGLAQSAASFSVTTPGGAVPAPTLTSLLPTFGTPGAQLLLTGTNLGGATAVSFNGAAATFSGATATGLTAVVPAGATTGLVRVTTAGGQSNGLTFTVTAPTPPTLVSFSPTSGPVGTVVTVSGTNFSGATGAVLNGAAVAVSNGTATSLTFTVPAGGKTGLVGVIGPGGLRLSAATFTVVPAPTITAFSPASGSPGSAVELTGTNLTGATAVTFGGVHAPVFTVNSATSITVTVPAGAATGVLGVTTPGGAGASSGPFTVTVPAAPTISGLSPASGIIGAVVQISGTNLLGTSSVRVNGKAVETFVIFSATLVLAQIPDGATTGPISLSTSGGQAVSPTDYTILTTPEIDALTPVRGPVGTVVTLVGEGFTGTTALTVGGVSATSFAVVNDKKLTATVPTGALSGPLALTTPVAVALSAQPFTVTGMRVDSAHVTAANAARLGLYPNPASGTVTVYLQDWQTGATPPAVELYDALGRRLRRVVFPDRVTAATAPIELLGVPAGVYIVRCGPLAQRLVVE